MKLALHACKRAHGGKGQEDADELVALELFLIEEQTKDRGKRDVSFRDGDGDGDGKRSDREAVEDPCAVVEDAFGKKRSPVVAHGSERVVQCPAQEEGGEKDEHEPCVHEPHGEKGRRALRRESRENVHRRDDDGTDGGKKGALFEATALAEAFPPMTRARLQHGEEDAEEHEEDEKPLRQRQSFVDERDGHERGCDDLEAQDGFDDGNLAATERFERDEGGEQRHRRRGREEVERRAVPEQGKVARREREEDNEAERADGEECDGRTRASRRALDGKFAEAPEEERAERCEDAEEWRHVFCCNVFAGERSLPHLASHYNGLRDPAKGGGNPQ